MTVSTFFPDANPESTSVDGTVGRIGVSEDWSVIRAGAGNDSSDIGATIQIAITAHASNADKWAVVRRMILLFDTSSILGSSEITAATLEFVGATAEFQNDFADSVSLVTSTPASNTALVDADYGQLGTTKQATDKLISSMTVDDAAFTVFTLNSTGEGNINKTGITKFGMRTTRENDDSEPTESLSEETRLNIASAEEILGGDPPDKRPRLIVTHAIPVDIGFLGANSVFGEQQPIQIATGMRPI